MGNRIPETGPAGHRPGDASAPMMPSSDEVTLTMAIPLPHALANLLAERARREGRTLSAQVAHILKTEARWP